MGKSLYEQDTRARELFDRADAVLGWSLSTISFDGPEEVLRQTQNTQPAIFLHSVILARLVEHSNVVMAAGHSLGEYSALVYAGAMTLEDGLKIVRLRGELMQRAGEETKGTMAAIIGLESAIVEEICNAASDQGVVQCANFNSPGQVVISGSVNGVRRGMDLAKAGGARLVKELPVSGAFHSPLMESAREGLAAVLASTPIQDARVPVYANVTARPVQKAKEIRTLLEAQLTSPVRWEESVRNMTGDGASAFIELGPGKVLQGLVKRIDATVEVSGIDMYADLTRIEHA